MVESKGKIKINSNILVWVEMNISSSGPEPKIQQHCHSHEIMFATRTQLCAIAAGRYSESAVLPVCGDHV